MVIPPRNPSVEGSISKPMESCDRWFNQDIPARYAELKADPSKGLSLDDVFARLEAAHNANVANAPQSGRTAFSG